MLFHSVAEAVVLIFPTIYAMTGGLLLQWLLRYNFSVAVWVGSIALFGIAVETGVVMAVYLYSDHWTQKQSKGRIRCASLTIFTICASKASAAPNSGNCLGSGDDQLTIVFFVSRGT